jgi:hypothetical protein
MISARLYHLLNLRSTVLVVFSLGAIFLTRLEAFATSVDSSPSAASQVTVSGISAGGFMAVQMHIALSSEISGVGVVAGGIYWCAEGNALLTSNPCMLYPWLINTPVRVQKAAWEAKVGHIDSLDNLAHSKVYVYASPSDPMVNVNASFKLEEFYSAFVDVKRIKARHNLLSSHGFPTLNYGAPCGPGGYPWMLNCGFDLAGELLSHLYDGLRKPAEAKSENLYAFDQTPFIGIFSAMALVGHIYVPSACQNGESCKIHVALHGCGMSPAHIGDAFIAHAGYNRWAEANQIIVLYPAVAATMANPGACWDWWGYTGPNYINKFGPQIKAIHAMIHATRERLRSHSLTQLD